jgi:mediator of RNA polymerase II transcription subunit 17
MKALESVTDDILKAATDLETEVKKEVKYWEEILDISAKGWYLQRLRRDLPYSPLAVRCGSHEASDQFKARGLAPLRMNKDGAIVLDPELAPKPRTLRVRIREHGKIVGCSRLSKSEDGTATGIEKKIRQARDSLFEEEMFHEMTIEARNLLPYGVELRDSVLNVQASSDRTVLIDCIPLDDEESTDEYATDDWLARTIAEGLRLLLSHEHRMRLFRRSQIPAPLTLNKRQTPPPPLLRTLLAVFAHLDAVDSLQTYLQKLVKTLETAGLPVTLDIKREVSLNALTRIITESPIKGLSPLDQIIQQFTKPLDSVATLSLPSPKGPDAEYVTIAIRTFFGPPTFGPGYKITLPPSLVRSFSLGEEMRKEFKFSSGESAHQYVDWVFSLHLTHNLLRKEYPKRAAVSVLEPTVIINGRDGKKVAKKEFAVDIKDGALTVTVRRATMFGVESVPECTWSWNGSEGGGDLLEKIHACVRR